MTIGVLAVATSAYLAAVYLAADACRLGKHTLELDFRTRALAAGVVAGAIALGGLVVVRSDARPLWDDLTSGGGLATVVVSVAAGVATLILVWHSRFGPARVSAALAVAAIVAGWGYAQHPLLLPGLTIREAAAGRSTLIAVIVAVAIGALVLVPSLALLFTLFLRGRLDFDMHRAQPEFAVPTLRHTEARTPRPAAALVFLVVGVGLLVFADAGWAHAVGIECLLAGAALTFVGAAIAPEHD